MSERRSPAGPQWPHRSELSADGEIHLWLTPYEEIEDERLYAAYRELLDPAERAQERRFHFPRDRRQYLVTRALVRTVLARYLSIDPEECRFAANAYGRPDVMNSEASATGLSFNISHTRSLIVLGVTRARALGVDVENVCARKAPIDVAERYFARTEVAVLNAAPRGEQQFLFFEYWTFKESYVKARGMGLSFPLEKCKFRYPGDRSVELTIEPEAGDEATRWRFCQFQPTPEYLVAICSERVGALAPALTVRRVVPLMSEELCAPRLRRVSSEYGDTVNKRAQEN